MFNNSKIHRTNLVDIPTSTLHLNNSSCGNLGLEFKHTVSICDLLYQIQEQDIVTAMKQSYVKLYLYQDMAIITQTGLQY